jgi:hypothetical protein
MTEKIIKTEIRISAILFWICFFITIMAIVMALIEFFTKGAYPPSNINIFYVGVLAIYSLHKEAIRFLEHSQERSQKKGETFVYVWILMTAFLYLINFLTKNSFSYSSGGYEIHTLMTITYTALEVGGVFVIARILKLIMIKLFEKNGKQ